MRRRISCVARLGLDGRARFEGVTLLVDGVPASRVGHGFIELQCGCQLPTTEVVGLSVGLRSFAPRLETLTPALLEEWAFSGGFQVGSRRDSFAIP